MGAWIEIRVLIRVRTGVQVAPHVGAWIEIRVLIRVRTGVQVAPHVGAWIEMHFKAYFSAFRPRRTPRGCVD